MINVVTALLTGQKDREKFNCILYNSILKVQGRRRLFPHSLYLFLAIRTNLSSSLYFRKNISPAPFFLNRLKKSFIVKSVLWSLVCWIERRCPVCPAFGLRCQEGGSWKAVCCRDSFIMKKLASFCCSWKFPVKICLFCCFLAISFEIFQEQWQRREASGLKCKIFQGNVCDSELKGIQTHFKISLPSSSQTPWCYSSNAQ